MPGELTAAQPPAVEAAGWGWQHAGSRDPQAQGVTFSIRTGERVLLLGASGSGKSTLLSGIAGVLGGDEDGVESGELRVGGSRAQDARGRVGLLLQDPDSQVMLARVGDDIAFGAENLGLPREEIWRRVAEAKAQVGLDVAMEHPTSELSGGQKQRLALAGVLAMRPDVLLLDEPTANLDPAGVAEVARECAAACSRYGLTLVVVEHRVDVWLPIVDRVIVLGERGRVVLDGPVAQILRHHSAELEGLGAWVPGVAERAVAELERAGAGVDAAARGPELLTATDLAVGWKGRTPVQRGLRVSLEASRALAVLGPNGAGKSTLALTLAGLQPAADGVVRATPELAGAAGPDIARWKSKQLITRIGTVFQQPEHQFVARTVRGELEIGPKALGLGADVARERATELLDRLRLAHLADRSPFSLSGGEQRRLSVGTVLATRPRVVILDEPTFGQDSVTWRRVVELVRELLAQGCAVVAVTHDLGFVRAIGADTLTLEKATA